MKMKAADGGGRSESGQTLCDGLRLPASGLFLSLCLFALLLAGCTVDERRSIAPEAQATIDAVTEDIAAGRGEKIYAEAADEWRARTSAEENQKMIERLRERLGRVLSRALHSGTEQGSKEGGINGGHTLRVAYQTTFERGTAMEQFTLLERDGRWRLAGYAVNSDLLKQ
ncbi:MAG: DUF4019 domain-containing protein [Pyrinomonadaceae bacterium]